MTCPILEVRGLTKTYHMGEVEVHALRGIDLEVRAGEFAVLVGASGSGKSTLLNILGGLDFPTAGTASYRGTPIDFRNDRSLTIYRRTRVGFVFQFYNLIPSLTAQENVELVTEIADTPLAAADALSLVGLADRVGHFPSQMSGGQQQRVAIARAVAKRPDLLLCDEPTGALDFATGRLVLDVLREVNEKTGTTTMVITHNAAIGQMADRVITMADGLVVRIEENAQKATSAEVAW